MAGSGRSLAEVLRRGPLGGSPGGALLGPYEVVRELGRGGMGVVFEATRRPGGERVALKVLLAGARASEDQLERFLREARAGAAVRHPGVVAVLDCGATDGLHYVAFEYVEGETLARVLERRPPPGHVVELVLEIASALAAVHERGLVHRDVKPANVLVRAIDGRPLLADFGLVRAHLDASSLTATGVMVGTPAYMAAEQVLAKPCSPATDVFALGAVLYEGLTGELPFASPNAAMRLEALSRAPRAPSALSPALGTTYDAVCRRALAFAPEARFPDAGAFSAALRAARDRGPRRSAWPIAVAIAVAALVGVAVVARRGGSLAHAPPSDPRPPATDPTPAPVPVPAPVPATTTTTTTTPAPAPPPVAGDGPPSWFLALAEAARPPTPLHGGLRFGDGAGEYVNVKDGSVLVWVPPGKFRMGWLRGQKGGHAVAFARGFFIGKYEVRGEEWKRYLAAGHAGDPAQKPGDGMPIGNVSWADAVAYCEWAGLRLPSEAEWEYAAHADTGWKHPWGDDPPGKDHANVGPHDGAAGKLDGYAGASPVGSFPRGASPAGCLDMAGNAWEWVADGWSRTAQPPPRDGSPRATADGGCRFARGGSYYLGAPPSFALERSPGYEPTRRRGNYGFRVAR